MATRNLTSKFDSIRSQIHSGSKRPRDFDSGSLLSDSDMSSDSTLESGRGLGLGSEMPPEWVDINDSIHSDLTKIKDSIRSLQKLHTQRLKVTFGDEVIAEQEREIEILTQEITRLLKKCENNVKKIAFVGNSGQLSSQERSVRLNVMRAVATDIQNQSKVFRTCQKDFLKNLREQETSGSEFGFDDSSDSRAVLADEDALDRGLNKEQEQALEELNARASEREKEIIKVAQSINELAQLFKELNVLVIEQGTILDRIDYNVEQATTKVNQGVKHLEEADEHSKKMYTLKAIICLAIVIIILIIVLIVKKGGFSGSSSSDNNNNGGGGTSTAGFYYGGQ